MTPRGRFRFWVAWLIGGLLAALFWYGPLLDSFWGSLVGIFIFGFLVSVPLGWLLTRLSQKIWARDWQKAKIAVTLLVVAAVFFYSIFLIRKHDNLFTGYDLAIFDQAIWHMSRLEIPQSTIRDVPWIFGDHFHPIITFLAPIYAIFPDARTLLAAQSLLLALGVVVIYLWARRANMLPLWAVILSFIYLTHPGIQGAANSEFHEIAFAPVLILAVFYNMRQRNWKLFFLFALLLLLVKEEFALWVAAIGVYLLVKEKQTRAGLATIAGAVIYFVLAVAVIMPKLNYAGIGYAYGSLYPGFENGFAQGVAHYLSNPGDAVKLVLQNPEKWWTIGFYLLSLAPFLLFAIADIILFIPALALRVFTSYKYLSYAGLYYNVVFTPLAMAVFFHFADRVGNNSLLQKLAKLFDHIRVDLMAWAIAFLLAVNFFYTFGYSYLLDPVHNWNAISRPYGKETIELLAQIPSDAAVSASSSLLPHLSQRDKVYVLPKITDAEYVIFEYCQDICGYWPVIGADNMRQVQDFLVNSLLYEKKFENQAGIVFKRVGDIDEARGKELADFCQKIINQGELEPIHHQYFLRSCQAAKSR